MGDVDNGGRLDVGGNPNGVALDDINGDGKLDLVTANWESNDVTRLLAR